MTRVAQYLWTMIEFVSPYIVLGLAAALVAKYLNG